jgi:CHAT domain-containing protein
VSGIGLCFGIKIIKVLLIIFNIYLALSQKMSKAEALRQAQLKQIKESNLNKDPKFWSSFILSGS